MTELSPKSASEINYLNEEVCVFYSAKRHQSSARVQMHFSRAATLLHIALLDWMLKKHRKVTSHPKHTRTRCSWRLLGVDSNDTHVIYPADPRSVCIYIYKKIIINWPNKLYLCLCFPTVLFERRMNKGTLSQRTLEKWHISSGIIVLCVSVAHFSFILMLSCTQITNSCIICKGLSTIWKQNVYSLHLIVRRSVRGIVKLG